MKKYKLLILGYPVKNKKQINLCFSMLTYGLEQAFKQMGHVTLIESDYFTKTNKNYSGLSMPKLDLSKIPNVDFIIVINYHPFFTQENISLLKKKCKKVISFLEIGELSDFSFMFKNTSFKQDKDKTEIISAPYISNFYSNVPKESKSILLDHIYLNAWKNDKINHYAWSKRIWTWLEEIKNEYKIYSLISRSIELKCGNPKEEHLKTLPKWIIPIQATNYIDYLKKTQTMETFIVTHVGSYNFSVIDMLVRGIRVLSPVEAIPKFNIDRFNIPIFNNRIELLRLINAPINKDKWNNQIQKCTGMKKVVSIIDNKIQGWLNEK